MVNADSGASRTLIGAKRRQQWSGDPPCDAAWSSYGLCLLLIKTMSTPVERCGRALCVQGPRGKRVLCVFHRSGTIHRLLRIIEARRGRSSTVYDAVETTIARRVDPEHPSRSRSIMISPWVPAVSPGRASSGLSASACARGESGGRRSRRRRSVRQSPHATRLAGVGWR